MDIEKRLAAIEQVLHNVEYKMDECMSQLDNIENLLDERFDELLQILAQQKDIYVGPRSNLR